MKKTSPRHDATFEQALRMIAQAIYANLYARPNSKLWKRTITKINTVIMEAQKYGQLNYVLPLEYSEMESFNGEIIRHQKHGTVWKEKNVAFFDLLKDRGFTGGNVRQIRSHIAKA